MPRGWCLIVYRTPRSPSTARVAAWRRLRRLGAIPVGPSACLLPRVLATDVALAELEAALRPGGGAVETYGIDRLDATSEARVIARYNQARDAEYAEVIERAASVEAELATEGGRGKYTFAEVEENEAVLEKLRDWTARVRRRDVLRRDGHSGALKALARAEAALTRFASEASARDEDGRPS